MTVQDLAATALRLAGVLGGARRLPSASDLAEALDCLNSLLDAWNTERLLVYSVARRVFPLTPGKNPYTIGASGDFDTPRPVKIERAGLVMADTVPALEIPFGEILDHDEWARLPVKDLAGTLPARLYYDTAYPLGRVYLHPVPTVANSLALYLWQTFSQAASLADPVDFPPGYRAALEYNLALELAARHPRATLSPYVALRAGDAKAAVKRINAPAPVAPVDPALAPFGSRVFDWRTGEFRR